MRIYLKNNEVANRALDMVRLKAVYTPTNAIADITKTVFCGPGINPCNLDPRFAAMADLKVEWANDLN